MSIARKLKEKVRLGPDHLVRRFIPYPGPVNDGTGRCIGCGQIDDDGFHNAALCIAIGSGTAIYEDGKVYVPIDDDARNGERQIVKRGPNYAAAQWTGNMWSYPYGDYDAAKSPHQIDFTPTHYWPQLPKELQP